MKIIELSEIETRRLRADLMERIGPDNTRTVKVHIDSAGLKYKIGEGMWTPSLGHDLDPTYTDPMATLRHLVAEIELAENTDEQLIIDKRVDAEETDDYSRYDEASADANERSAERLGVLLRAIRDLIGF